MSDSVIIETPRILLRHWRDSDRPPFAVINADPRVMEFFPSRLSPVQSEALAAKIKAHLRKHGFGLYAAELKVNGTFAGFIGLNVPSFRAHFTPCVEIGWRLGADLWGQGLATEGAQAVLKHAKNALRMKGVVSFTVPANVRSRRVMEKLGMSHDPADDFNHPQLPPGHPLRRHVLYRLRLDTTTETRRNSKNVQHTF